MELLKSLLGGTSKIWAGTNNGTVKELSLSGHKHSASAITSGTLSISRGGTGTTSLSLLASALSGYLPSSGGKTSLFNKSGTVGATLNKTNIGTVYNCNLYDFIIITISGSTSISTVLALYIGNQAALGFSVSGSSFGTNVYMFSKYLSGFGCTNEIYTGSTLHAGTFPGNSSMPLELYANSTSNVNVSYNIQIQGAKL